MTDIRLALLACACATTHSPPPKLQVLYQSSTSLADTGANIDGKLCYKATHWDVTVPPQATDTIDLRADNRHYVIGPSGPAEHRLIGAHRFGREPAPERTLHREAIDSRFSGEGSETIDLRFGPDHLTGRVGWQQFDTHANGDHLEGTYKLKDMPPVNVRILGMDALWALPLAEQGVLLPSLLFCANNSPTHDFDVDLRDLKHTP